MATEVVVDGVDWRAVCAGAADRAVESLAVLDPARWADQTGWGADGTATAAADLAAETAVVEALLTAVPSATVVSEEMGVLPGSGDTVFIVDPLDGTNNAVRGIPYWAVSIGILRGEDPAGGFVRNVGAQEDFFAWRGSGAWRGDRRAHVSSVTRLAAASVGLQRPAEPAAFARSRGLLLSAALPRILGAAALDMVHVGCGALDGYANVNTNRAYPFGERVVDYAAAAIFVQEAGGVTSDPDGEPLVFSPDLSARVPVVAAATPELHNAILAVLAEVEG